MKIVNNAMNVTAKVGKLGVATASFEEVIKIAVDRVSIASREI